MHPPNDEFNDFFFNLSFCCFVSEKNVKIGEKLKLNCLIRGRGSLSNVNWYKDDKLLQPRENQRIKLQTKK